MRLIVLFLVCQALAACAGAAAKVETDTAIAQKYVATGVTDANEALAIAGGAFAVYKNTPNPSAAVVKEATQLQSEAQTAIAQYGPESTQAIGAAGSLLAYLLTSAPGDGVTPSSVPTSP
jgi:hypothetical protein